MSRSSTRDLLVGLFVLAGLGAIAYLSFSVAGFGRNSNGGLILFASFDQTGGLKPRAPVEIAGVKVGQVSSITLDKNSRARVELNLDASLQLPVDTTASIMTAGILGDRFVSLQVGGDDQTLRSGEEIGFTESAVLLERLIGKLVHNVNVGGNDGKEKKE
ncbi:outer membrane lipid asymmetry maintenance protein MlaD [Candidatus Binatia bacterium]|nr:outer membrane lipid asymmetry maintenance protein MlaD [Candidatus Binatia bacterium]